MALNRVLDTNAVLYLLGGRLAEPLPEGRYFASVMTEMELLSYPLLDEAGHGSFQAANVLTLSLGVGAGRWFFCEAGSRP